eukprot:PhM_4_TR10077/c0_g1_i2/m.46877
MFVRIGRVVEDGAHRVVVELAGPNVASMCRIVTVDSILQRPERDIDDQNETQVVHLLQHKWPCCLRDLRQNKSHQTAHEVPRRGEWVAHGGRHTDGRRQCAQVRGRRVAGADHDAAHVGQVAPREVRAVRPRPQRQVRRQTQPVERVRTNVGERRRRGGARVGEQAVRPHRRGLTEQHRHGRATVRSSTRRRRRQHGVQHRPHVRGVAHAHHNGEVVRRRQLPQLRRQVRRAAVHRQNVRAVVVVCAQTAADHGDVVHVGGHVGTEEHRDLCQRLRRYRGLRGLDEGRDGVELLLQRGEEEHALTLEGRRRRRCRRAVYPVLVQPRGRQSQEEGEVGVPLVRHETDVGDEEGVVRVLGDVRSRDNDLHCGRLGLNIVGCCPELQKVDSSAQQWHPGETFVQQRVGTLRGIGGRSGQSQDNWPAKLDGCVALFDVVGILPTLLQRHVVVRV